MQPCTYYITGSIICRDNKMQVKKPRKAADSREECPVHAIWSGYCLRPVLGDENTSLAMLQK